MSAPELARPRIRLAEADRLGAELLDLLRPFCVELMLGGSVRRRVGEVKDIELLAVPVVLSVPALDLFDDAPELQIDALDRAMGDLLHQGTFIPYVDRRGRPHWGMRNKRAWYDGAAVDLWCCPPEEWGAMVAIRTGPAGYAHAFVTSKDQRVAERRGDGSVVYRDGLLPVGYRVKDQRLYGGDGRVIETPDERAFFAAIGIPFLDPWRRR